MENLINIPLHQLYMAKQEVKEVDIVSVGKLIGIISGIFGLFAGGMVTVLAIIGRGLMGSMTNLPSEATQMIPIASMMGQASIGIMMGIGSIFILPIVYGISGFIMGIINAFIYNLIAGAIGGIEVTLGEKAEES